MWKIGLFLGLVVAAMVITMVFRRLRDRSAGRRRALRTDYSGDNMTPGANFWDRPNTDTSPSESGGGNGD